MGSTASFLIMMFIYVIAAALAIIWMTRRKKAGRPVTVWVKVVVIFIFWMSGVSLFSYFVLLPPESTQPVSDSERIFYVKSEGANVRKCPSISCEKLNVLTPNTAITFSGDSFDKYPDWAEVTLNDGRVGYVSKTMLSENSISTAGSGSSSVGGLTIGPWSNIQAIVGQSYKFYFCEPIEAASGATCGGLAGATTDPRGGRPPYSFVKASGFLPPGMALELNGIFSGTPTQKGTYNFRLCAKDLYGGEGCQDLAVVVKKDDAAPITSPQKVPAGGNYKAVFTLTADTQNYYRSDTMLQNSSHISVTITATRGAQDWQGGQSSGNYTFSSSGRANSYKSGNCVSQISGTFGNNVDSGPGIILGGSEYQPLTFNARTGYAGDYRDFDYQPSMEFCATWPPDRVINEILNDIMYGSGGGIALKNRTLNPAGETISFSNDYAPEHIAIDRVTYSGTLTLSRE